MFIITCHTSVRIAIRKRKTRGRGQSQSKYFHGLGLAHQLLTNIIRKSFEDYLFRGLTLLNLTLLA